MNLVQRYWEGYHGELVQQSLDQQLPANQEGIDRRGFEWFYWRRKISSGHVTLKGHAGFRASVSFSHDGQQLASAGEDGMVKVWDAATGQETLAFQHASAATLSDDRKQLVFSHDGKRLMTVGLTPLFSHDGRRLRFKGIGVGYDGIGEDGRVKVWDAATGQATLTLRGQPGAVKSVAFSPDGSLIASASSDGTARLWDAATGQQTLALRHTGPVWSVAFSPDGRRIASISSDRQNSKWSVNVWDALARQEALTLKGHTNTVMSVAFSPDGSRLASASKDGTVKVWDSSTGQEALTLKGHTNIVMSVAFSPDGRRIASASEDGMVKVWDAATGQQTLALEGHAGFHASVAFSHEGKRLTFASIDGTRKQWDLGTGQEVLTLKGGYLRPVLSVAFSADGKRLASATDFGTVRLWDAGTGAETAVHTGPSGGVTSVAFSPDGSRLATACADLTVKVWDAATEQEIRTLRGHTARVTSVAFSPDGSRLATTSEDGAVKLWDAATGQETLTLNEHTGGVLSVAFSPDGQRLATAGADLTVKVWDAQPLDAEPTKPGPILIGPSPTALGRALTERGWWDQYDRSGHVWSTVARFHLTRGEAPAERGLWEPAEAAYAEALRAQPFDSSVWSAVARFHLSRGRAARAAADLTEAVRHQPDDIELRRQLGLTLLIAGDRIGWRRVIADLRDRYPGATNTYTATCVARACAWGPDAVADPEAPVRLAEAAVKGATDTSYQANALNSLGAVLYRAGRFEEAIRRLGEAVRILKGGLPVDWAFLAMAHDRLGHHAEARRWLERLRNHQPSADPSLFWHEMVIRLLRSEAEAVILYDPVFPADPFAR
jgi:WD40 repeat protein/tetratricopeptide (TPR) repeat protein